MNISDNDFLVLVNYMKQYLKFRVSMWARIVACYLPKVLLSKKT